MKRIFFVLICSVWALGIGATDYNMTVKSMTITDFSSTDYADYVLSITAVSGSYNYDVYINVHHNGNTLAGTYTYDPYSFSNTLDGNTSVTWVQTSKRTIRYVDQPSSVVITHNGGGSYTLSASLLCENDKNYYFSDYAFTYTPDPEPLPEDPYQYEPTKDTAFTLEGDIVRAELVPDSGWLNIHLGNSETLCWAELNILSDTADLPAGTYSFLPSRGYLGNHEDDPAYVAVVPEIGTYIPYYLISGSITVDYPQDTTIHIVGNGVSKHGSAITFDITAFNPFYVAPAPEPPEPEHVELAMEKVKITYLNTAEDSYPGHYTYSFQFNGSGESDYPELLYELVLPVLAKDTAIPSGTYLACTNEITDPVLFQNQEDYNRWLFYGETYVFDSLSMTVTNEGAGDYVFDIFMRDTIGSTYWFSLATKVEIEIYPAPETNPAYDLENRTPITREITFNSINWNDSTVTEDHVLLINLADTVPDTQGGFATMQLMFFTPNTKVPAGTYPIDDSDLDYTFSASLGYQYNVLFPCTFLTLDAHSQVTGTWFLMNGYIGFTYPQEGIIHMEGVVMSYYGSTFTFHYQGPFLPTPTALEDIDRPQLQTDHYRLQLVRGHMVIEGHGHRYNILGGVMPNP